MKRSVKELLARVAVLLVGLTIAHIGVTLFLLADLGSDPFNVLIQGIFRAADLPFLTHGRVHVAVCFLIILVLLITDRSYVKLGTLLCMICGGPIIDVCTRLLGGIFNSSVHMAVRIAGLAAGCVILAYGMTIVMKSECGVGPNDLVAIVISDKLKKPFSVIRILTDISFVAAGWLLGGSFGIGTIICAFLVGPVAGIFLPANGRLVKRIMDRVTINAPK